MEWLTPTVVYNILAEIFPKQNDFAASDYTEELNELFDFGIKTKEQFIKLLQNHFHKAMEIDAEPLDDFHIESYKKEYGDEFIENKIRNNFWFAYPALLRIVLELEFGEKYIAYANKRDNINT
ncbi:MAG: hypothetical protein ACXWDO_08850 [Bacteroidia bacterium]